MNYETETETDTNADDNINVVLFSDSEQSLDSELSSIDLENFFTVKRIKHNRNRPRITNDMYHGSLAFDVVWEDDSETREPLQNFISNELGTINEDIMEIIKDYKRTAMKYPKNNRFCIMCYCKVNNGNILCNNHNVNYNFLNEIN